MKNFLIIFLFLVSTADAQQKQEKIDYVNLGATLIKDGYLQRAKVALDKVDIQKENFEFARYYSLKGILMHRLGYPTISNIYFRESVDRGQDNRSIYLYVARNNWQLMDYEGVITALENAGDAARENEQMFVIKAESYKHLENMKAAWETLDEGIERFPEYSRFYRQKFYYLLDLGYYLHAMEYADKYLQQKDYSAKDYLAVSFVLRENGRFEQAAALLEEAVIQHSANDQLIELLGQVYIDQEKYLMAALVYDYASLRFPKFAPKAATLYLKSGQPIRSLQINRRIVNQEEKFRQRLGIDIQLEDYESLVAKTDALKRYGLLSDDNFTYAIGFGYFKNGEYDKAKQYLKQITDGQLFNKASYIFAQIENCQNEPALCI